VNFNARQPVFHFFESPGAHPDVDVNVEMLIEGTRELKTVPLERYTEAEVFFGS